MNNTHVLGVDTHFNSFVMIAMISVKTRLWLGNGMNSIDKVLTIVITYNTNVVKSGQVMTYIYEG